METLIGASCQAVGRRKWISFGLTHRHAKSREPGHEYERSSTVLNQGSQVCKRNERNPHRSWTRLSIWSQLPGFLPTTMRESISTLIRNALHMLGEAMTFHCEQQNAKQPHLAGNFRSPSIRDVDDSIVVRAKEYKLSAPVVAPKTWEAISAGNSSL